MTVLLTSGQVTSQQISQPVSLLTHYFDQTISDNLIQAPFWDDYLVGLTSTIFVGNQPITLAKQVGYIMGFTKNRKTQLLSTDLAPIAFS